MKQLSLKHAICVFLNYDKLVPYLKPGFKNVHLNVFLFRFKTFVLVSFNEESPNPN